MFIGHFAVGFAAKAVAPRTSLGSLFLAAQFLDLLWPTLLLLDVEEVRIRSGGAAGPPLDFIHYPVSHSLLAVLGWSLLVGVVYQALRRYPRGAVVLGLAVLSHWLLDLVVHYPDLPLYPGDGPRVGFALWASPLLETAIEMAIFAVGLGLYLCSTAAVDATGRWALWALAVFLAAVHLGNSFGPPPPSLTALAWVGQGQWLLVLWGWWVDRHRRPSRRSMRP